MAYSDITINDPNAIKRWLQNARFNTAIDLYDQAKTPLTVLDFGAGNGHLCLKLANLDRQSKFLCYEPSPTQRAQAVQLVGNHPRIQIIDALDETRNLAVDTTFCLEVMEHLPEQEMERALDAILSITKPEGMMIFGVPNEIFGAAAYKGLFRLFRRRGLLRHRYSHYEASLVNIFKATVGFPPKGRPVHEMDGLINYHFTHMGFDHRAFEKELARRDLLVKKLYSPSRLLGQALSPEIYYQVFKRLP